MSISCWMKCNGSAYILTAGAADSDAARVVFSAAGRVVDRVTWSRKRKVGDNENGERRWDRAYP